MKNNPGRPYGGSEVYKNDDTTAPAYMQSIIGGSDSDDDIPFALDSDEDTEVRASKIYIGDKENDENDEDKDNCVIDDSNLNNLIDIGITEEFMKEIPQDKLQVIIDNKKAFKTLIKGRDFGFGYKLNGIEISQLVEIINAVEVDKLDLFLSKAFNVLSFADCNKSVSLMDLLKLDREFIILFLDNPHSFSKIIEDISLDDLVKLGHEKASYAISYFSYRNRNYLVSFPLFIRLFDFNSQAIKDIFTQANTTNRFYGTPLAHLKANVLNDVKNMKIRSKEIPEVMTKAHINDWGNLLLCDILFSKASNLTKAINEYPSAKYKERGMEYIIKLYEEQSKMPNATKDNKPDVKGKFCGVLLFCQRNVISILDQDLFSLDDMQAICNEYPEYLKEILSKPRIILEWNSGKDKFYQDIGLENGDQFFSDLKKEKPTLFVFYMKFKEKIPEVIAKCAITLSDIEDMYLVSIKSLEGFFKDEDLILKWVESRAGFYSSIGLEEGYEFFSNIERKRMSLFLLVFKFHDEILYMHQESIMSFQDMVYIYDRDPLILQAILNNPHKIEWLMKDEKYKSIDDILNLFSTNGENCLKKVDIIEGGLITNKPVSLHNIKSNWDECYKKGFSIESKSEIKNKSKKNISFDGNMHVVFFDKSEEPNRIDPEASTDLPIIDLVETTTDLSEEPNRLILHLSKNSHPKASTALPYINLEKPSANLKESINNAINTNLPYLTQQDSVVCSSRCISR